MTDDQLARAIQSVGMAALVTHLPLFRSAISNEGAAAALNLRTSWAPTGCRTRVWYARTIIEAGRLNDALGLIADASRVPKTVRDTARQLRAAS